MRPLRQSLTNDTTLNKIQVYPTNDFFFTNKRHLDPFFTPPHPKKISFLSIIFVIITINVIISQLLKLLRKKKTSARHNSNRSNFDAT